jgi:cytochrome c-type biogenesis protein CcmH
MLPLLLAVLAAVALIPVLLPLLRGERAAPARASFDRAVYRDQLRELDRDVARGLISDTEAASARLEIQRRLLATESDAEAVRGSGTRPGVEMQPGGGTQAGLGVSPGGAEAPLTAQAPRASEVPLATATRPPVATPDTPATKTPSAPKLPSRSPVLAAVLGLLVVGGAVGLYARLGAPGIPDMPYASRASGGDAVANGDPMDMRRAAAQLAEKLATDPTDAQAWLLFAHTQATLSQWDKAADAFRRAMVLGQTGPQVQGGYGEMLVMQAQGIVTPAARDAFAAALKSDPKNEVSRYYMALAAGQAGEPRKAIDQLQALAADLPADSGMRAELGKRVAEAARQAGVAVPALADGRAPDAAPGPDEAAMAAAAQMPEADRKAMVSGMVAKLADRLAANPSDFDGWMRLGRAYGVMNERDKAADAFAHAASLRPDDAAPKLMAIEVLLAGLRPGDTLPSQAVGLLHQVQLIAPDEPAVLWYLGIVAVRDGHKDEARSYWTRLLAKLPPDSEDAGMVKTALQNVQGS